MSQPYFITGIGTGVGKTVVSAILAEALEADYWKPVQAGFENGTDSEWLASVVSNSKTKVFSELYKLKLAASPHLAAKAEGVNISPEKIFARYSEIVFSNARLIIEGAGGLMVPLNDDEFVLDLVQKLNCKVILVSRNYLGSINHSLLTAQVCRLKKIRVAGWIFNDRFMDYEDQVVRWSGYPKICSVPLMDSPGKKEIAQAAADLKKRLLEYL